MTIVHFVYFSWKGSSQNLVTSIIKHLSKSGISATFQRVEVQNPRCFQWFRTLAASEERPCALNIHPIVVPENCSVLVTCSPVWGGNISSGLRAALQQLPSFQNKVVSLCTARGSAGNFHDQVKELLPHANIIHNDSCFSEIRNDPPKFDAFVDSISTIILSNI
ncbi:hypothetical protein RCL1_006039 [Eukaryota sp. TZLM3-RCL]